MAIDFHDEFDRRLKEVYPEIGDLGNTLKNYEASFRPAGDKHIIFR